MNFVDWIVLAIIVSVASLACWYIYRSKKKGKKCIGCPDSGKCSGVCSDCCGNCNQS